MGGDGVCEAGGGPEGRVEEGRSREEERGRQREGWECSACIALSMLFRGFLSLSGLTCRSDRDPVSGPDDLKLIYNGKILENNKTFEDYKVPLNNQIIMHIQPRLAAVNKTPASTSQEHVK
mmetsp:Transcript_2544/g.8357  ORF Transcript_2544/g.8357 Transcript_2544/m.8357 type:complete len:121 (+) Transcript_2544:412-774(+)